MTSCVIKALLWHQSISATYCWTTVIVKMPDALYNQITNLLCTVRWDPLKTGNPQSKNWLVSSNQDVNSYSCCVITFWPTFFPLGLLSHSALMAAKSITDRIQSYYRQDIPIGVQILYLVKLCFLAQKPNSSLFIYFVSSLLVLIFLVSSPPPPPMDCSYTKHICDSLRFLWKKSIYWNIFFSTVRTIWRCDWKVLAHW